MSVFENNTYDLIAGAIFFFRVWLPFKNWMFSPPKGVEDIPLPDVDTEYKSINPRSARTKGDTLVPSD